MKFNTLLIAYIGVIAGINIHTCYHTAYWAYYVLASVIVVTLLMCIYFQWHLLDYAQREVEYMEEYRRMYYELVHTAESIVSSSQPVATDGEVKL